MQSELIEKVGWIHQDEQDAQYLSIRDEDAKQEAGPDVHAMIVARVQGNQRQQHFGHSLFARRLQYILDLSRLALQARASAQDLGSRSQNGKIAKHTPILPEDSSLLTKRFHVLFFPRVLVTVCCIIYNDCSLSSYGTARPR
jgi:hypothetical protein